MQQRKRLHRRPHRGAVTLWTILTIPALLAMLCFVVEATNLWLSRTQLSNALEAAALAAVKSWGKAGGGLTVIPRQVGVAYASYNGINEVGVVIDDNYSLAGDVNGNESCDGDLIFGEVSVNGSDQWVFDTTQSPSCGVGSVLYDATGEGTLSSGNNNTWGVAFLNEPDTPTNLRICSIIYTLPPPAGNTDYYFETSSFGFANNNSGSNIFNNTGLCDQNDVVGLNTGLIGYSWSLPSPNCNQYYRRLTFTFPLDGSVNEFAPCDRFRFAVAVRDLNNQCNTTGNFDGDDIGDIGVTVTTVYANSGGTCNPLDPALVTTSTFVNNTHVDRTCFGPYLPCYDPGDEANSSHILTPPGIPNLPNGVQNNNKNKDSQSYVLTGGPGGNAFGVRAQATVDVPSLCAGLCGIDTSLFQVSAKATAMYDCTEQEPRLIRVLDEPPVDNFNCVDP